MLKRKVLPIALALCVSTGVMAGCNAGPDTSDEPINQDEEIVLQADPETEGDAPELEGVEGDGQILEKGVEGETPEGDAEGEPEGEGDEPEAGPEADLNEPASSEEGPAQPAA